VGALAGKPLPAQRVLLQAGSEQEPSEAPPLLQHPVAQIGWVFAPVVPVPQLELRYLLVV
jgi:hypothetical protein